jgi:hypothetical protein
VLVEQQGSPGDTWALPSSCRALLPDLQACLAHLILGPTEGEHVSPSRGALCRTCTGRGCARMMLLPRLCPVANDEGPPRRTAWREALSADRPPAPAFG